MSVYVGLKKCHFIPFVLVPKEFVSTPLHLKRMQAGKLDTSLAKGVPLHPIGQVKQPVWGLAS